MAVLVIQPDGRGDVTQTHVAWHDTEGALYVPSMIVGGDFLLSVNNSDDDGQVNVIKPGRAFERVATYELRQPQK